MRPEVTAVILEYDIARNIAGYLYPTYLDATPWEAQDLIRFGLTCRALYHPAMDILWYCIDGLAPLLHTFPPAIRAIKPNRNGTSIPCASDWSRFLSYAARVREIRLPLRRHWLYDTAEDAAYKAVAIHRPSIDGPLFPKLHTISRSSVDDAFTSHVPLFISSTLQSISLRVTTNFSATNLLDTLRFRSCRLRCFELSVEVECSAYTYDALRQAMRCWPEIETFKLTGHWDFSLKSEEILHLSRLYSLTRLGIGHISITRGFDTSKLTGNDVCFPSLCELGAEIGEGQDNLTQAEQLIRTVTSPALQEISLHVGSPRYEPAMRQLFSAMEEHRQLRIIIVDSSSTRIPFPESDGTLFDVLLSGSTLEPLFGIPNITALCIDYLPFALYEEDIHRLAESWPSLQVLRLSTGCFCPDFTPCLPYSSLIAFKACPDLYHLSLVFATILPDMSADREPVGFKLQVIDVGQTDVDDSMIELLAEYLVDLFPNVSLCITETSLLNGSVTFAKQNVLLKLHFRMIERGELRRNATKGAEDET
ncbi:hypothetical protein K474DRAFT_1705645 [Panus rudis PR-1116 ss-1]|nr:hypothetical protein K474DRAFT_1705645 [Panus rudis PR-1116 ss-1]